MFVFVCMLVGALLALFFCFMKKSEDAKKKAQQEKEDNRIRVIARAMAIAVIDEYLKNPDSYQSEVEEN